MSTDPSPLGVYVHVPFCRARCAYCDFAIVVGQPGRAPRYVAALAREAARFATAYGVRPADTLHFGGGTPSSIDPPLIGAATAALRDAFDLRPGAEIALEANPEDVTETSLAAWRAAGVNRLALGVQALVPEGLEALGRPGTVDQARRALRLARESGIASLAADVIFGRPGQQPEDWSEELDAIVALDVDHLSLYALETDAPTPLVRSIERGRVPPTDPDAMAAMYEMAVERLAAAGFARYEISNFARPGHESRHNLKYWTDRPYAGLGQSAASYVDGARWINPRRYPEYVASVEGAGPEVEPYDADRRAGEALVFGLRRPAGIDLDQVAARHGAPAVARREPILEKGAAAGLVRLAGRQAALTDRGMLLADEVFVDLL